MTDREKFKYMCRLYYDTMTSGTDNIDEALEFMSQEGLLDEDGDWIYAEE